MKRVVDKRKEDEKERGREGNDMNEREVRER
jgi:hypothetical protein